MTRRPIPIALLALALALAACGKERPSAARAPQRVMTTVTIHYLVDSEGRTWLAPERHQVDKTSAIGRAALEELVHGTAQDPDHVTPIPRGAKILDLKIEGGTATVDWSADVLEANAGATVEALGIQSIVWTLTEFPTVKRVAFTVEGKPSGKASNGRLVEDWWGHVGLSDQPFARQDAIEVLEPITIWTPLDGVAVGREIAVTGEASTFEANVAFRLLDATGKRVSVTSTTASAGAPERGAFSTTIQVASPPASPETWRLEAYEASMEDGRDTFVETRSILVG
ncbi:MAG: GerMN domain-containing protein [Acidobacteria bacterium]|nr:GerMN domain-containing protein [Acidobacteriota bacterium]